MPSLTYGDDWDYAGSRLRESVVRNMEGHPLFVYNVHDNLMASCQDLLNSSDSTYVELSKLDLSPVNLGYCNKDRVAIFATRSPCRFYKQGLTQTTLRSYSKENKRISVTHKALHKTIKGLYPSLAECAESVLTEEVRSMAFSRNFALRRSDGDLFLFFREHLVGSASWNSDAGQMNYGLENSHKYLQELLEEEIQNV